MDVRRDPDPNVLGNVQTWRCAGGNPQQVRRAVFVLCGGRTDARIRGLDFYGLGGTCHGVIRVDGKPAAGIDFSWRGDRVQRTLTQTLYNTDKHMNGQ